MLYFPNAVFSGYGTEVLLRTTSGFSSKEAVQEQVSIWVERCDLELQHSWLDVYTNGKYVGVISKEEK